MIRLVRRRNHHQMFRSSQEKRDPQRAIRFGTPWLTYTGRAGGSLEKSLEKTSNCGHKNLTDFSQAAEAYAGKADL
jgi:hypothetical protein